MVTLSETEHGVVFRIDGQSDIYVDVLFTDSKHGAWLWVGTEHTAQEVRVTPAGRKVESEASAIPASALGHTTDAR